MPRKPKPEPTAEDILQKIREAGLSATNVIHNNPGPEASEFESLDVRLKHILSLSTNPKSKNDTMLFFVMYDIESNKVRNLVAKYLIKRGCFRIQHSIYLADMAHDQCEQIKDDLAQVQAAYDNHDSILVVPISTDYLRSMRVIGKALDVDIIMHSQNTLFF